LTILEFSTSINENNYFYTLLWLGPLLSYSACYFYEIDYG